MLLAWNNTQVRTCECHGRSIVHPLAAATHSMRSFLRATERHYIDIQTLKNSFHSEINEDFRTILLCWSSLNWLNESYLFIFIQFTAWENILWFVHFYCNKYWILFQFNLKRRTCQLKLVKTKIYLFSQHYLLLRSNISSCDRGS